MSVVHFKIVITARDALPWLRRCLESTARQSYPYFDVCMVDDASDQAGQREIMQYYARQKGWRTLFNEERQCALANRVKAIEAFDCDDEDVIVNLDGDDWWLHDHALARIAEVYLTGQYDMTYGQHVLFPRALIGGKRPLWSSRPMSTAVLRSRSYRSQPWSWFHPYTFRHFLWRSIVDDDLRGPSGEYFKAATDSAFLFPLLEMAGRRCCCLREALYVYNIDNASNEFKQTPLCQYSVETYIRSLPPYPVHERCQ